jgi:DNA-binding winged helix-turn-helix (wHTH) protein
MRVRFGPFVLDSGARELSSGGVAIHLSPKAFDILEILVERRPNVVGKEVLLTEVWPDRVVEEANLAIAVGEIRKALGDTSKPPAIIKTVSRRGYRFGAEAVELGHPDRAAEVSRFPRWWLTWRDKTLPLREGDNLLGRHPASGIWIDGASVSRTHAKITVTPTSAVVEDCGSRNGTFVNGKKITAPHPLVDGNTVTFGSEATTIRQWSDDVAMGTEPVRRNP